MKDKLIDVTMAEQEREKHVMETEGFEALLMQLEKRKNACGYNSAP